MLERLENLENNLALLHEIHRQKSVEKIQQDKFDEWALRYGLFESIQIVIDIACHIAGKYNLGPTKTYAECIEKLARHAYLDSETARRLIAAIGLRNLLIHEYARIDPAKLYGYLDHLEDFKTFIRKIRPYI